MAKKQITAIHCEGNQGKERSKLLVAADIPS